MGTQLIRRVTLLTGMLWGWLGSAAPVPWAVYYSDREPAAAFDRFRLLVFDSDRHPPLAPLAGADRTLLGYISLAEIAESRSYFPSVKADGILLGEHSIWKHSYYVDVRDERWRSRVLNQLIPAILNQGFSGVFLDNLDDPAALEDANPAKYRGMRKAAVELVRSIRQRFPAVRIMLNRGYRLLDEVADSVDMVLGESVFTDYDFHSGTYHVRTPQAYREQVQILETARERHPALEVFTLDYWNPRDKRGIARIYRTQRANGFAPYVATIGLDQIVGVPQ
jgi:polysaccharide biosynthesis protein PelA